MSGADAEHCRYHPLVGAGWRCVHCERDFCDDCIAQGAENRFRTTCLLCDGDLESLGGAADAEPFWRRLEQSFRYPLTPEAGGLVVGGALLTAGAGFLPGLFGGLLYLFVAGVLVKYAFSCLKETANGRLTAPGIAESYDGGILLLFQLLVMLTLVFTLVGILVAVLGAGLGGLLSLVVLLLLPAMVMLFAVEDRLAAGLNIAAAWRLATTIGLPYGILLGLLLIMTTSVAIIEEFLGGFSFVAQVLEGAVSNYYTIVMFHIMGYVVFQYQRELGYLAERDDGEVPAHRSEREILLARLDVLVAEGRFGAARKLFDSSVRRSPTDHVLAKKYLDYLVATRDAEHLRAFASVWFERSAQRSDAEPIAPDYHAVRQVLPDYLPDSAEGRVVVARELHDRGESKAAAELLHNLHKAFPKYRELPAAYRLMADALEALPRMAAQAKKYRAYAQQLERRRS